MVYVLVLSGGIVCITDASHGCPDWPECHGRWFPPKQTDSIIEYSHRVLTPLTLPVLLTAAFVAWRRYRREPWVVWPTTGTIVCLLAVVVFGALVILTGLPRGWAAADLGTALMALALMVAAASAVRARSRSSGVRLRPRLSSSTSRLAAVTTAVVFAVLVGGVLVARPGALMRCLNWPGVIDLGVPEDLFDQLYWARFGLGLVASGLITALLIVTWKNRQLRRGPYRKATAAFLLMVAGTIIGWLMPTPDRGVLMPAASMATAAALWAVLVAMTIEIGRYTREPFVGTMHRDDSRAEPPEA